MPRGTVPGACSSEHGPDGQWSRAATIAAAGIVSSQATTMLPATPQRIAASRFVAPAPITEPETT